VKSKLLAIAVFFSMLSCGVASAQWPNNTYGNQNQWEVEIGSRILDRPASNLAFSLVTITPSNATVFNAEDASELGASAGADFRFSKASRYGTTLEFRGTFNNWHNMEARGGVLEAPLFTPTNLPAGSELNRFTYEYDSNLFSVEMNFKRAVRPGMTLMIGPRYVDLTEQVDINSTFGNITPGLGGFRLDIDSITEARNHMPGLGFGVEFRRPIIREVFFVGSVKGAVLANFASTETTAMTRLIGSPPIPNTIFEDSETQVAGIGEISAKLHYDVAPGTVSAYMGYEAFWLDGVAVAPAQLLESVSPPIGLNTSTTSFAHGLVLGVLVRY